MNEERYNKFTRWGAIVLIVVMIVALITFVVL